MRMNRQLLPWALLLAVALAAPWLMEDQGYAIRVVTLVLLFAAMGQSWNIVGGLANQISLGHAAFFGLGAYTSTLLLMRYGISPWLGIVAAMAVAAMAGALLSLPTMRLRGHYFALATLAFGEVLRAIANNTGMFHGQPFAGRIWYTRVFVWRDGRWQAVTMQQTPIPG